MAKFQTDREHKRASKCVECMSRSPSQSIYGLGWVWKIGNVSIVWHQAKLYRCI